MKQYKPSLQPASRLIDAAPQSCRQTSILQLLGKKTSPAPSASAGHENMPDTVCQPAAPRPACVVQRAVGFEFETGWLVEQKRTDESGKEESVPFKKKDVITTATPPGFRMEADEAGEGKSEIEFVVRPPVEESPAGYDTLRTVMENMEALTDHLCLRSGSPFFLHTSTGSDADKQTYVTPRDTDMCAGPQATTAICLDKVPEFMQLFSRPLPAGENVHPGAGAFKGLATLVGEYVRRAQPGEREGDTFAYPKMMAEPLLARTDFVGLFRLIEPRLQEYYLQNKNLWTADVLRAAGLPPDMAQRDMLGRGVVDEEKLEAFLDLRYKIMLHKEKEPDVNTSPFDERLRLLDEEYRACEEKAGKKPSKKDKERLRMIAKNIQSVLLQKINLINSYNAWFKELKRLKQRKNAIIQHAGFTVQEWLEGLLEGADQLTTLKDAESMGEFGPRTEGVGKRGDMQAGIFEWRGDQTGKIPAKKWKEYALGFMEKIFKLHEHTDFRPPASGPVESHESPRESEAET